MRDAVGAIDRHGSRAGSEQLAMQLVVVEQSGLVRGDGLVALVEGAVERRERRFLPQAPDRCAEPAQLDLGERRPSVSP